MGLMRSCHNYDPSRANGSKFTTYATVYIYGSLNRYVSRCLKDANRIPVEQMDIDIGEDEGVLGSVHNFDEVEARDVMEFVEDQLSHDDMRLLKMRYIDNLTFREIADEIGVSHTWAKTLCERLMSRLESIFEDD